MIINFAIIERDLVLGITKQIEIFMNSTKAAFLNLDVHLSLFSYKYYVTKTTHAQKTHTQKLNETKMLKMKQVLQMKALMMNPFTKALKKGKNPQKKNQLNVCLFKIKLKHTKTLFVGNPKLILLAFLKGLLMFPPRAKFYTTQVLMFLPHHLI